MPDFGNDTDVDEETDESSAFGNELSIFQTYKTRLADIESALEKKKKRKLRNLRGIAKRNFIKSF